MARITDFALPTCGWCGGEMPEGMKSPCRKCRSDPFPSDTYARKHGWRIVSRPKRGPDIWTDDFGNPCGRRLTIGEVIGEIEARQT